MTQTKTVRSVHAFGSQHWVGDGFPVRNLFPSNGVQTEVDPFLMLDYMGPAEFTPSPVPRGVGEHPHRGFETVTLVFAGGLAHRDSAGNAGTIGPGDVQWMTAASGVVHEEMHDPEFTRTGGVLEGAQLWVNLPARAKMSAPRYQSILAAQIPTVTWAPGASARIIAGTSAGVTGPAETVTPISVWDARLAAAARVALPLPAGHNTALVVRTGTLTFADGRAVSGPAQLVLLSPEGESIELASAEGAEFLVLTGAPLDEPVVQYGPFVMNTEAEIRQAFADYRAGRMGQLA